MGSVMMDKHIRAVVILAEYPKGENPYGAHDWERVKKAGARLHNVVKEVDPNSLQMSRKGSAGLISFMNQEAYQSLPVKNYQFGSDPQAGADLRFDLCRAIIRTSRYGWMFPGMQSALHQRRLCDPDHRSREKNGSGWTGRNMKPPPDSVPISACGIRSLSWKPTGIATITASIPSP